MNIYVETNFILELTFQQEQCESCEQILELCQTGQAKLIIPAYSLAEPHEKLIRQAKSRQEIKQLLDSELQQLSRTAPYQNRIRNIQDIENLLIQSNDEEQQRFINYRERLVNMGEIIPLTAEIILEAAAYEVPYGLRAQDALIYASVISHLHRYKPQVACFLNRNSKDFGIPNIRNELQELNCRMIPQFDHGYNFLKSGRLD